MNSPRQAQVLAFEARTAYPMKTMIAIRVLVRTVAAR
jgi:hypothetical protein